MFSDQRKRREFVVEADGCFPAVFGVALRAAGTQLTFMSVVFRVTGDAIGGELFLSRRRSVACGASGLSVPSL